MPLSIQTHNRFLQWVSARVSLLLPFLPTFLFIALLWLPSALYASLLFMLRAIWSLMRLGQVTDALEAAQAAVGRQQGALATSEAEQRRATLEMAELRRRASTVEETCRENERLKGRVDGARVELQELTHRFAAADKDLTAAKGEVASLQKLLQVSGVPLVGGDAKAMTGVN